MRKAPWAALLILSACGSDPRPTVSNPPAPEPTAQPNEARAVGEPTLDAAVAAVAPVAPIAPIAPAPAARSTLDTAEQRRQFVDAFNKASTVIVELGTPDTTLVIKNANCDVPHLQRASRAGGDNFRLVGIRRLECANGKGSLDL